VYHILHRGQIVSLYCLIVYVGHNHSSLFFKLLLPFAMYLHSFFAEPQKKDLFLFVVLPPPFALSLSKGASTLVQQLRKIQVKTKDSYHFFRFAPPLTHCKGELTPFDRLRANGRGKSHLRKIQKKQVIGIAPCLIFHKGLFS